MNDLRTALKWRYAASKFDTSKDIPAADLNAILEAGNLMPTGFGLQPFRIIAITDQATKDSLLEATYGQTHAIQNSALIVIAIRTDLDDAMVDEYTARIETTRGLPAGSAAGFGDSMKKSLGSKTQAEREAWAAKQAYIALGGMIAEASLRSVDNHGLEGFNPATYNDILKLNEKNLSATVILALGYRAADDEWQKYAKVRVANADMITTIA